MPELRAIVRIVDADITGETSIYHGLRKITGVSYSFANAVCHVLNLDREKQVGMLSEDEVKKIEAVVKNPEKLPKWLYNRRKDYDSGNDLHLTSSTLRLVKDFDIKHMKKIKSYKGMRHSMGLPVRGQATKAHFRHGKTVGVTKKAKAGKTS